MMSTINMPRQKTRQMFFMSCCKLFYINGRSPALHLRAGLNAKARRNDCCQQFSARIPGKKLLTRRSPESVPARRTGTSHVLSFLPLLPA